MSDEGVKSWAGNTRHGTHSGWVKHKQEKSDPCEACVTAKREYDARRRAMPENTQRNRIASRAQSVALRELARRYPEEYRALYEEAADALFAEAGFSRRRRERAS